MAVTLEDLDLPYYLDKLQFIYLPLHIFHHWTNIVDIERNKFHEKFEGEPEEAELAERIRQIHSNIKSVDWEAERLNELKFLKTTEEDEP